MQTAGIHHISAIIGDPQENVDFYAGILGLRLVKKTVNFDDPGTYHLYFGDEAGSPGTIMTFFPWPSDFRGRIGDGQVGVTSYVVPEGALPFWIARLEKLAVPFIKVERFGEEYVQFDDPHGLQIELVARKEGENSKWAFGEVTSDVAIKGFGGATLYSSSPQQTADVLTNVMGLELVAREGDYVRYKAPATIGNIIDLKIVPGRRGAMGPGTVHHIAWRAKNQTEHLQWQEHVMNKGLHVTDVKDRHYFEAIYFREPGGILFEIATDSPGFAMDEIPQVMGSQLMLPPQYEHMRAQLESNLPSIQVRVVKANN
ncbi:ring-cleaving dioxygenase [Lysinibacillus sp. KU-BSD001]|uniref:ring-cleaving dioxygenase n=1 Tax=Lysinibacillus sp. KU-BSD001 TaxID=3141328 RepID=UPI0036E4F52B